MKDRLSIDVMIEDYALTYSKKGFCCSSIWGETADGCECEEPLCERPGRHPVQNIADSATNDTTEIKSIMLQSPHRNIGLVTGSSSQLIGLKVNPLINGADDAMERLCRDFDLSLDTIEVETPFHRILLFNIPNGIPILPEKMVTSMYPGIELMGEGNFTLIPPSRIPSAQGEIKWIRLSPVKDLSSYLIEAFLETKKGITLPLVKSNAEGLDLRTYIGTFYTHLRDSGIERLTASELAIIRGTSFSQELSIIDIKLIIEAAEFIRVKEVSSGFPIY